jgi:uncharacterized protein
MGSDHDEDSQPHLKELPRDECLALIEHAAVGRVVMSEKCIPVAYPVNVSMVDDTVVFATDAGSKLDAARRGDVVTIQVDQLDPTYHTGWSVLVTGVAAEITDDIGLARARQALNATWRPGQAVYLVRVPTSWVSGRRLGWGLTAGEAVRG